MPISKKSATTGNETGCKPSSHEHRASILPLLLALAHVHPALLWQKNPTRLLAILDFPALVIRRGHNRREGLKCTDDMTRKFLHLRRLAQVVCNHVL